MRVTALAVIALVSAGCGTASTSPARVERAQATTTTSVPHAVALVLETRIPPRVPTARLIAGMNGREVAQTGVLFTSDWTTRRGVDDSAFIRPRWPHELTIVDPDTATLVINTTALPDWLVVKTYATLSGTLRTPDARPIEELECMRFTEPKCNVTMTASGFRIDYDPRRVFAGSYIVVFGIWHVPLDDQRPGSLTPDEVVASWLFHFVPQRDQAASRS